MSQTASSSAVERRRRLRIENTSNKEAECESLKNEGNDLFKEGEYIAAANSYVHAINLFGPKPVLLSNLAAAYLKLELYEEAIWASTVALEFDPKMSKARYRRAMARKGLLLYQGALKDMEIVVSQTRTDELFKELETVRRLFELEEGQSSQQADSDLIRPDPEDEAWVLYVDSDTEDSQHTGNGTTCRFYNHQGCRRNTTCDFSHAPDNRSVRDELGKNVCLDFLLDKCNFGASKCIYSHVRTFLPSAGWWNDQAKVEATKRFKLAATRIVEDDWDTPLEEDYTAFHDLLMKHPKANGYASKMHRKAIAEHLDWLHKHAMKYVGTTDTLSPVPRERFILLIAIDYHEIFKSIHGHLLSSLRGKIQVVEVFGPVHASKKALQHLESPNLAGVLVVDPGIIKPNYTPVLARLVQYTKNGGVVVLGGSFGTFISPSVFDDFVKDSWGLDWRFGSCHRTTFQVNPCNDLVKRNPSLVASYSMKSVHVRKIKSEEAIYIPGDEARLESLVFSPVKITDKTESPAVCTKVGEGLFCFLGDVNAEQSSTKTILAMLGLLDGPTNDSDSPTDDYNVPLPTTPKGKGKAKASSLNNLINISVAGGPSTITQTSNQSQQGIIVVLGLTNPVMFERIHGDQLSVLKQHADVKMADTTGRALEYLALPNIWGVYIVDDGIAKSSNSPALMKVIEYAKNGGLVLLGGLFSAMAQSEDWVRTFKCFGVSWKQGSFSRVEAKLNREHEASKDPQSLAKLPKRVTMKAALVSGYEPTDVFYEIPIKVTGKAEAPILRTNIEKGKMGYIGDLNSQSECTQIILAMFDLLNPKKLSAKPLPDSQKFFMISSTDEASLSRSTFLKEAKKNVEILLGLSNARIIDLLTSSDLLGVLVSDSSILEPQNAYLSTKLVEYVKNGGTVIFAFKFLQQIETNQFGTFFRQNWGLHWQLSKESVMSPFSLNRESLLGKKTSKSLLPSTILMESASIQVPHPTEVVYLTHDPKSWNPEKKMFQGPIVFGSVEKGHVGVIGSNHLDGELGKIFNIILGWV